MDLNGNSQITGHFFHQIKSHAGGAGKTASPATGKAFVKNKRQVRGWDPLAIVPDTKADLSVFRIRMY